MTPAPLSRPSRRRPLPRRQRRRRRRPREPRSAAHRAPTWALLVAGVVLVALAGNRAGVAALGWIAPVPLALAATRLRGWRGRALLLLACVAAMSLQTLKLVGGPATPAFALVFGVPIGALGWAVLALWDVVQRRAAPAWGIHAFAALTALADVAGFALTPGGHWAASAASQAENLPLMQVASLGGLGLVGLVLAYPAGAAAVLLLAPAGRRPWRSAAAALAIALAAHAFGTFRLDRQDLGPTVRVAGVTVDFPETLRSMEDLRGNLDVLFERSELAARRGAQLVSWNEVATLVDPGRGAGARGARRRGRAAPRDRPRHRLRGGRLEGAASSSTTSSAGSARTASRSSASASTSCRPASRPSRAASRSTCSSGRGAGPAARSATTTTPRRSRGSTRAAERASSSSPRRTGAGSTPSTRSWRACARSRAASRSCARRAPGSRRRSTRTAASARRCPRGRRTTG